MDRHTRLLENNGKTVTIDGLRYKINASRSEAIYPYRHVVIHVYLEPVNKNSTFYKEMKEKLRDNWVLSYDSLSDDNQIEVDIQLESKNLVIS